MVRRNGGFIGTDGLDAPDPPTGVAGTAGDAQVSVAFTAPTDVGTSAITGFVAQVSTNDIAYSAGSNTGTSSPIVVSSLTNDTAATAKVWAINAYGTSAPSDASASFTPVQPQVGLFMGGTTGSNSDVIDKIDLVSTGNASDFGNLLTANVFLSTGGASSGVRGVVGGGDDNSNVMQYVTIATAGNATDFGDLSHTAVQGAWCSSATRGVHAGGGEVDIEYITIDTTGNTTDFGDLVRESQEMAGVSSTTRGVFASLHAGNGNDMGYITIASAGNDTDFGDLLSSITNGNPTGGSNNTRGIFAGGPVGSATNVIQYITIASTGDASDFGDLTETSQAPYGVTGLVKMAIAIGRNASNANSNVIDQITIATTGNATDFGDLSVARQKGNASVSQHHGGIAT